jgi:L,D-transpeptidase ErfK/SrfK
MQWNDTRLIILSIVFCTTFLFAYHNAYGTEFEVKNNIIGFIETYKIKSDDSLIELARKFDLGYNEIVAANPGVDPILPDQATEVIIPAMRIIPDVQRRKGIVINISEMRLYYFPPHHPDRVVTFPIGIGDDGWETPTGTYEVVEKIINPAWHVPLSIKKQKPELPDIVPPGPDNPLGTHALRLSIGTVLIHGTDRPFGIGRKVSHGCIHLYPEDIPQLFAQTRIGTKATIIRQPVKVAILNYRVMVEVHGGLEDDLYPVAYDLLVQKGLINWVDPEKLAVAASEKRGIPEDISWQ